MPDKMNFWERIQERWQAYKQPIWLIFWSNMAYAVFGSNDCAAHHCTTVTMNELEQWFFHILMICNVLVCPIWIKLIALRRKHENEYF